MRIFVHSGKTDIYLMKEFDVCVTLSENGRLIANAKTPYKMNKSMKQGAMPYERPEAEELELTIERNFVDTTEPHHHRSAGGVLKRV